MKFQYMYIQGIFKRFINRRFVLFSEKKEEKEDEEEVTECLSN